MNPRSSRSRRSVNAVLAFVPFLLCLAAPAISARAEPTIQVAVFKGEGVGKSVNDLLSTLENATGNDFVVRRLTADEIREGELSTVDVLVHPGGSGSKQGNALGEQGRNAVKKFVTEGGGYLGVCGGAYLATNDYSWSLNLIDAKCVDRRHWARGTGIVTVNLSSAASALFGHAGDHLEIYYGQGPLLGRPEWDDEDVPDYESLAIYDSEIAKKGAPKGVMVGTSGPAR